MHIGVSTYRLRVLVKKVNPKFCVFCKTLSEKSRVFASTSVRFGRIRIKDFERRSAREI